MITTTSIRQGGDRSIYTHEVWSIEHRVEHCHSLKYIEHEEHGGMKELRGHTCKELRAHSV